MAIDFSQVKAISIPSGDVKQVSIGGVVVWKKPVSTCTISYRKAVYQSTLPTSIVVPYGYALTSADLPTQTDSAAFSVTGWTLDGTNPVSVGTIVTSDITLCAIHQWTKTTTVGKNTRQSTTNYTSGPSVSIANTLGDARSSSSTMTNSITKSYTGPGTGTEYYCWGYMATFIGQVGNFNLDHAARVEWTPSRSSVGFTNSSGITQVSNYTATYPCMVIRHVDDNSYIYSLAQNSTNKISYSTPEPHSGSTIRVYIQHGGSYNGTDYGAWRTGYKRNYSSSDSGSITANPTSVTEVVTLYTLPVS